MRPEIRFALSTRVLRALTVAVLAAGYVDLVRGGVTLSAALLTFGYLVMVPLALLGE